MKLLLFLLCSVTYHYCNGYLSKVGEISEDVLTENDSFAEYSIETTNVTSWNDSLPEDDIFKNRMGNRRLRKIWKNRNNNSSGKVHPESLKWFFIGIGVLLVATTAGIAGYFCLRRKSNRDPRCEFQQVSTM